MSISRLQLSRDLEDYLLTHPDCTTYNSVFSPTPLLIFAGLLKKYSGIVRRDLSIINGESLSHTSEENIRQTVWHSATWA